MNFTLELPSTNSLTHGYGWHSTCYLCHGVNAYKQIHSWIILSSRYEYLHRHKVSSVRKSVIHRKSSTNGNQFIHCGPSYRQWLWNCQRISQCLESGHPEFYLGQNFNLTVSGLTILRCRCRMRLICQLCLHFLPHLDYQQFNMVHWEAMTI